MIERDYIMRMVTLLSAAIAKILLHKDLKQFPLALTEINNAGRTLLGIDRDLMHLLSVEQLIGIFGKDDATEIPKTYVLGVLLREEAEITSITGGHEEALSLFLKSLSLLTESYVLFGEPVEPGHAGQIDFVAAQLSGVELPAPLAEKLIRYYGMIGKYDKADDILFDLIDRDGTALDQGIRFYEELLKKTDSELARGNLPREEVQDTLADLKRRNPGMPQSRR
jgi:hypothetical protein